MKWRLLTNNKLLALCLLALLLQTSISSGSFLDTRASYTVEPVTAASYSGGISKAGLSDLVTAYLQHSPNPITSLYNERLTRKAVREFFVGKTGSENITNTVLLYAEKENMPIDIVFSLVFVESSFRLYAVNTNKNSTQDMGLFQLNTNTFRYMQQQDFFHLETNVKAGIGYLKYAFGLDPDPKVALAIYNAGPSRPLRGIIPESTQKYIARILAYSKKLNGEFAYYMRRQFVTPVEAAQANQANQATNQSRADKTAQKTKTES